MVRSDGQYRPERIISAMSVSFTPCSGCGMCEEIAVECASSGACVKQILEFPHQHRLPRTQIEQIEREHFPYLFEVCHSEIRPRPAPLQTLWNLCLDY